MESLEDRRVLALLTVFSFGDSGPGTLRDAITQANAMPGADSIQFISAGTIVLASGDLVIRDSLTVNPAGLGITIQAANAHRVFTVDDGDALPDVVVSLKGFTLSQGGSNATAGFLGGAILNTEQLSLQAMTITESTASFGGGLANVGRGVLTASQLALSGNSALYGGGAVFNGADSKLTITDGKVTGNTAGAKNGSKYSSFGGGLYSSGDLTLTNVTFSSNVATHLNPSVGGLGGGLSVRGNGDKSNGGFDAVLHNVSLEANLAQLGGGLHVGAGDTSLVNSVVSGNTGTRGGGLFVTGRLSVVQTTVDTNLANDLPGLLSSGGAAFVGPMGELTMDDSFVNDNRTQGRGGAIYASSLGAVEPARVTVRGSSISGNIAGSLGGGFSAGYAAELTIENSQIDSNLAPLRGGGIYVSSFGSTLQPSLIVRGSTISGNTAAKSLGGGINLGTRASAEIENSVIRDNQAYDRGGGIYASNFAMGLGGSPSTLVIQGSQILNNSLTATKGASLGGGLMAGTNLQVTITNTTIADNDADANTTVSGAGGGAYLSAFGTTQT
ncbi:MAG TPA: right-handed parallel beta-helix repeat-containing protein, partial [Pirellulaceae bacterium]